MSVKYFQFDKTNYPSYCL